MTSSIARLVTSVSAITLSAASLFTGALQAQVNISPMIIETQETRGQAQGVININNSGNETYRARIYTEPFTYDRDTGFKTVESSPNDLSPYLQFSPREVNIKPGESRRIRLLSRLAPNLPDGEYRTVVFTEELKELPPGTTGNQVLVKTRVGVTVYVRKGVATPKIEMGDASLHSKDNQVQLLVRNTGKASISPKASWTIKQGEKVIKTHSEDLSTVLAGNERNLVLSFPDEKDPKLAPGEYQVTGELSWQENKDTKKMPFSVKLTVPGVSASR